MRITTITRTISGHNYSNVSATAEISATDSIQDCFIRLDGMLQEAIERCEALYKKENDAKEAFSMFQEAIKDVPF